MDSNVEAFKRAVSAVAGHPLLPAHARMALTLAGQVLAEQEARLAALAGQVAGLERMLGRDLDRIHGRLAAG